MRSQLSPFMVMTGDTQCYALSGIEHRWHRSDIISPSREIAIFRALHITQDHTRRSRAKALSEEIQLNYYAIPKEVISEDLLNKEEYAAFPLNGRLFCIARTHDPLLLLSHSAFQELRRERIRRIFSAHYQILEQGDEIYLASNKNIIGAGTSAFVFSARSICSSVIPATENDERIKKIALKVFNRRNMDTECCDSEWEINRYLREQAPPFPSTPLLAFARISIPQSKRENTPLDSMALDLMEGNLLMENRLFHDHNRDPTRAITRLKNYAMPLLSQLAFIHENKICHNDLKLENILVKGDRVMIADFGISTCSADIHGIIHERSLVQTLWYRAPEVFLYIMPYTEKIDIWSMAIIFFELLTGEILLKEKDETNQFRSIVDLIGKPDENFLAHIEEKSSYDDTSKKNITSSIRSHTCRGSDSSLLSRLQKAGYSDPLLFDLMEKMLRWDPERRLSAKEALAHPFFKEGDLSER